MKCQRLFSRENIISLLSAGFVHRMVNVNKYLVDLSVSSIPV